ncbi:hypothetical protein AMATHDRAFT_76277 [Amanita thiersii Skay4041]|uniref:[histone H3]-trimethyl-L-lysine(4) demethylase n=1 Tax=Amanita thiersii Skay4041 TaxID=703135 RepID=A0A2A9NNI9_9AGAR|nr:hypothetical protein AMATHDRAFT_76277 [Amanita thiersii Skay4041]
MHGSPSANISRGTPSRRGKSPRFSTECPSQAASNYSPSNYSNKPATNFTSSLNIRVDGTTPIHTDSAESSRSAMSEQVPPTESKRAPRKSKTEALVALNNQARTSSVGPDDADMQNSLTAKYRDALPIPVTPVLDLSTVKTTSPRSDSIPRVEPRPFGLVDCPEYYPTPDEFKEPMAYIRSIADHARNYGICKIVPPANWKMPFMTDTETFRFKTRVQQLNSIEASSRAKINFLEQLYRFHKQQGNPRVSVPTINHKPLDLWLLRKEVQKLGGYDAVTKNRKWSDLGRILGYRGIPGLSTQLRNSYSRVILPYEHFCERARNSPAISPTMKGAFASKPSRLSTTITTAGPSSPPSSPLTATSSPLSEPPDDNDTKDVNGAKTLGSRARRGVRNGSQDQLTLSPAMPQMSPSRVSPALNSPVVPPPVFYDKPESKGTSEQNCEICHKQDRGEEMLLCDGCDCGFHMFCLDPPLDTIPKDQWFCYTCLAGTGGDFGFDEGEEHSLSTFQARDLEFRRMWFAAHPPAPTPLNKMESHPLNNHIGNVTVSEYDMEHEFWRLVQSQTDTVEIEYGADVHSTTHGSAMPTLETHPLDPYSKDPWNLNNIPILSESLLRFIKSDISGMTVPWTYVGMAFSTFCWHNEDHYTYSINYMHWGETKTWYGIPGDDAEKFEAAIKYEAPELFEAQPDLLFQLVTLMNPQRVSEAGVRIYACNQRAGEFVVTFPKAYHAGFNHGFNFNEAVNFALPDWLPYGRDCVQRYREHRKLPVFSHDELLITITQQSPTIKTAMWLVDSLKEMTERELDDRRRARANNFAEVLEEGDRPEEQYQCDICKVFCYLSQITCSCTARVVCVDHAHLLCDSERSNHSITLRKRFSDEELSEILAKVEERAAIPSVWRARLNRLLTEYARPPLRSLRALLAEGERNSHELPELISLRKCINKASEWLEAANGFIVRKQSRKRSRRSRGRPSVNEAPSSYDDPGDRPDRGLDDLYALLREVEDLGFDCSEIETLHVLAERAEDIKKRAATLLSATPSDEERRQFIQKCRNLLLQGSSINVLLDELTEVEKIVDREELVKELEEKLEDPDASFTLEEIRQFINRAQTCNLPSDNKHMQLLLTRQSVGDDWEERARSILGKPIKTINELEEFANMDSTIPIDPAVYDRLMASRAKAKDFEKQAIAWLHPESGALRPRPQDVMRLVNRAEKDFSIVAIQDLKRTAQFAIDLEEKSDVVLRNGHHPEKDVEDPFDTFNSWKTYARDHLSMFSLPTFEVFDSQLKEHTAWVRSLPWYCGDHQRIQGQKILDDVVECTRYEDDLPPTDEYFTCICNSPVRPPPQGVVSDAVQCDHCFARFHGECAKNGGSCPFCDHHHWNGAIHKERNWHFCYLPTILAQAPEITRNYSPDWKQLEIIVHRVDRLSAIIGQFLHFTSQPANQRSEYIHQVRHYMRKLYKIQFAVSPHPDISFGLDLAGLHRILAGRPAPVRSKKRRRPRFTFGQDVDPDWRDGTRCICRGRNEDLMNSPSVECESCGKLYHAICVFFPYDPLSPTPRRFTCPLCCVRKSRNYAYSELRVQTHGPEVPGPDYYVSTKEMLDTFSKDIIFKRLPPPYTQTLFIELVRFQPGQPDVLPSNGSRSSISDNHQHYTPPLPGPSHPHTIPVSLQISASSNAVSAQPASSNQHAPPPPPWSRWATMSTPSRPPSTQRRQIQIPEAPCPPTLPPPSRKRRHAESSASGAEDYPRTTTVPPGPHGPEPAPKRRILQGPLPIATQPPPAPARPTQTLSPSLALIVSPTNESVEIHTSPKTTYIPVRNGKSGSPLPPSKGVP